MEWLLGAQNADGGWGGAPGIASSIEETGLAAGAIAGARMGGLMGNAMGNDGHVDVALGRAARFLAERTDLGRSFPPSPIGFYFARLWYFERLYPIIFATTALGRMARLGVGAGPPAVPG
jgi:squalene-hopene/tetraprenyl-beta-curcumene cyclase